MHSYGSLKVKICGMKHPQNIMEVSELMPDYMGFIFYAKSPRYVGKDFTLPSQLPSGIRKVGVFVNETLDEMMLQKDRLSLDALQLHGNEGPEIVRELKRRTNAEIFKVFSVDELFDFEGTKPYYGHADCFLFDTKGKYYGGNAVPFNWSVLEKYDQSVPFLLSGGLNADNVTGIGRLEGMNIYGIDVNSGVETAPGLKDKLKIRELLRKLEMQNIKRN